MLALVVLLSLAGCGSLAETDSRDPFTVNRTATTTAAGDSSGGDEGIVVSLDSDRNRIGDPATLVGAQERFLDGTSYRVRAVDRVTTANGTILRELIRDGAYAKNRTRYRYVETVRGENVDSPGRTVLFADGDRVYRRQTVANRTTTTLLRDDGGSPFAPSDMGVFRGEQTETLSLAFEAMTVTSVETLESVPRGMEYPVYRLQSTTLASPDRLAPTADTTVENATLDVIVDAKGQVRELVFRYTLLEDGERRVVTNRLAYMALGTTTVDRPTWTENATDASSQTTARSLRNR